MIHQCCLTDNYSISYGTMRVPSLTLSRRDNAVLNAHYIFTPGCFLTSLTIFFLRYHRWYFMFCWHTFHVDSQLGWRATNPCKYGNRAVSLLNYLWLNLRVTDRPINRSKKNTNNDWKLFFSIRSSPFLITLIYSWLFCQMQTWSILLMTPPPPPIKRKRKLSK